MNIIDWKDIDVYSLINEQLDNISKVMNYYNNSNLANRIILDKVQMNLLAKYSEKLKLTKTQSIELILLSENFKKNNGLIAGLDFYFKQTPKSKQERNKVFDKIRKHLST
jgi:hypothetical protein